MIGLGLASWSTALIPGRSRVAAQAFVGGRLANMRAGVLRAALREDDADAYVASELIGELAGRVPGAAGVDELLGLEGAGSREYFQALRRMLDEVWGFEGRQRRPRPTR